MHSGVTHSDMYQGMRAIEKKNKIAHTIVLHSLTKIMIRPFSTHLREFNLPIVLELLDSEQL